MRPMVRPSEKYGDTLACLDVFTSKQDVNDTIVEGLTSDYDTEYRAHFNKSDISRVDIESILRERFKSLESGKSAGGRHHAVIAGGRSRGGPRGGGRGNHGGGARRDSGGVQGRGYGGSHAGSVKGARYNRDLGIVNGLSSMSDIGYSR